MTHSRNTITSSDYGYLHLYHTWRDKASLAHCALPRNIVQRSKKKKKSNQLNIYLGKPCQLFITTCNNKDKLRRCISQFYCPVSSSMGPGSTTAMASIRWIRSILFLTFREESYFALKLNLSKKLSRNMENSADWLNFTTKDLT